MTGVRARRDIAVRPTRRVHGNGRADQVSHQQEISGPSRGLKLIGSILAPTTLLTALLFYFGHQHAYWFFDYFGVNSTVMGLTTQDYLLRSVDPLFTPVTTVAAVVLVGLWGYRLLRANLSDAAWQRVLRTAVPVTAALGLVLEAVAISGVVDPLALRPYVGLPGLGLATGVLLLVASSRLRREAATRGAGRREPTTLPAVEWGAIFVLVGIGLFWAATDYSNAVGTGRGFQQQQVLPALPDVILYSEKSLSMQAPGVRQIACQDSEAAYRFRYDGLKLVLQSGGHYFFLPARWNPSDEVAFVIPRTEMLRLEFTAAGAPHQDRC